MDAIALDGYLDDETVPDVHGTTARFRLAVSPTHERVDEMILPCSVVDPLLAHAVLHELQPGDKVRVTGYLRLPRTPDDVMWMNVDAIEVLAVLPLRDLADEAGPDAPADLSAHQSSTLPDDGLLERYGPYIAYLDPETAMTRVWTENGLWVGTATYPDTADDLIDAYERRTTSGETGGAQ